MKEGNGGRGNGMESNTFFFKKKTNFTRGWTLNYENVFSVAEVLISVDRLMIVSGCTNKPPTPSSPHPQLTLPHISTSLKAAVIR